MKFYIETYGCQMNVYDSHQMESLLQSAGHDPVGSSDEADLLLLNTCAIRDSAEQRIWGQLGHHKRWKEKKSNRILALCGCMAQNHGKAIFDRAPYVDLVLGPGALAALPAFIDDLMTGSTHRMDVEFHEDPLFYFDVAHQKQELSKLNSRKHRYPLFVSIMRGCNYHCTYCVVPRVRGKEVHRSVEQVLEEVRYLADQGYREVTLIGQTVNSYHDPEGKDLADLLREVATIDGIRRIRFATSHPRNFSSRLIDAIAGEAKVCEHIHLPVQSGSDRILRRMARRYTADYYRKLCEEIRAKIPGVGLTTDLIIGFPGETDEDFMATLDLMKIVQWDGSFIFKYSPREQTAATRLPDPVPEPVVNERFQKILDLQMQLAKASNERLLGETQEILIEEVPEQDFSGNLKGNFKGRTRSGKMVVVHPQIDELPTAPDIGDILSVRITQARPYTLHGNFVNIHPGNEREQPVLLSS